MKILHFIRNIRILIYLIKNFDELHTCSLRKAIKEARYELGYDDVGEWF